MCLLNNKCTCGRCWEAPVPTGRVANSDSASSRRTCPVGSCSGAGAPGGHATPRAVERGQSQSRRPRLAGQPSAGPRPLTSSLCASALPPSPQTVPGVTPGWGRPVTSPCRPLPAPRLCFYRVAVKRSCCCSSLLRPRLLQRNVSLPRFPRVTAGHRTGPRDVQDTP